MSSTVSWSLLKFMYIQSMMPSNQLILCRPLLLLPSLFSSIRVFSNESTLCIRWAKYWGFSFSISPSNELISFRIWLIWSPCSSRDSQETFPAPQFESIHSSVLSLVWPSSYICTYDVENYSFDCMDLWLSGRVVFLPVQEMQETWVLSLGQKDPLEEETQSSILVWRIPWTEKPGGLKSMGSQRLRCNWACTH